MATQTFIRGALIGFTAGPFTDAFGNPVTPASVQLTVNYPVNGVLTTYTAAMTNALNGYWTATWNSAPSDAANVDWFANTPGGGVQEGSFHLAKNRANPGT